MKVVPEKTYSVKEAARYLGVHRCTIYAYIRYLEKPLAFLKIPDKAKRVFRGTDLIVYKETGLPKRGRKRKKHRYFSLSHGMVSRTLYLTFIAASSRASSFALSLTSSMSATA